MSEEKVNDLTMNEWLLEVDKILSNKIGVSSSDMADFGIWDCWNSCMSPEDGAYECASNDDLPWEEEM